MKSHGRTKGRLALLLSTVGSLLLLAPAASAVPVALTNPSFEADVHADGGFAPTVSGWATSGGDVATFNPEAFRYSAGSPTGDNVAALNSGGFIYQELGEIITAGTTYTLTFDAALRTDACGNLLTCPGVPYDGWQVELRTDLAGGNDNIATSEVTLLSLGTWTDDLVVSFTALAGESYTRI